MRIGKLCACLKSVIARLREAIQIFSLPGMDCHALRARNDDAPFHSRISRHSPLALALAGVLVAGLSQPADAADDEIGRAGAADAGSGTQRYALAALRAGKELLVYRIDTLTGETWSVLETAITPVKEKDRIPQGSYELAVIPTKDGRGHWAVRIDRNSGRMWYATENQWLPYQETP
jgi:hypothetical protein